MTEKYLHFCIIKTSKLFCGINESVQFGIDQILKILSVCQLTRTFKDPPFSWDIQAGQGNETINKVRGKKDIEDVGRRRLVVFPLPLSCHCLLLLLSVYPLYASGLTIANHYQLSFPLYIVSLSFFNRIHGKYFVYS